MAEVRLTIVTSLSILRCLSVRSPSADMALPRFTVFIMDTYENSMISTGTKKQKMRMEMM